MTRYLLITLAAATSASFAQEPSRFRASIDNFGGHTYSAELRDGKLVYSDATSAKSAEPITITPSAEQWRELRRTLDEIGVWIWHENYVPNEPIMDGTGWSFSIRYPDRSLVSGGGNCYPDAQGNPTGVPIRTPGFTRFEAAIEALLGGRPFRSADHEANR